LLDDSSTQVGIDGACIRQLSSLPKIGIGDAGFLREAGKKLVLVNQQHF
jgi:hypothetical protein